MDRREQKVAGIIEQFRGQDLAANYLAYFHCFNEQLFFEAHEVLEKLWLPQRHEADGLFYKGLIQLAGAFVHLQKDRLRPAAALFRLARANLMKYPAVYENLDVSAAVRLINSWLENLERDGFVENPLNPDRPPKLALII